MALPGRGGCHVRLPAGRVSNRSSFSGFWYDRIVLRSPEAGARKHAAVLRNMLCRTKAPVPSGINLTDIIVQLTYRPMAPILQNSRSDRHRSSSIKGKADSTSHPPYGNPAERRTVFGYFLLGPGRKGSPRKEREEAAESARPSPWRWPTRGGVAVSARKLPDLEKVAEEIRAKGRRALAVSAHLREMDAIRNMVDAV